MTRPPPQPDHEQPVAPLLEFAVRVRLTLGERLHVEDMTSGNARGRVLVSGGDFSGPGLRGEVLAGGGDFPTIRPDGVVLFDAHYVLREQDGTIIFLRNRGVRHAQPEVNDRLQRGEPVEPAEYYMRTTPRFDVVTGPHDWLARTVFVGVGRRLPAGNIIDYFRVR